MKRRVCCPIRLSATVLFLEMTRQMEVDAAWIAQCLARAQRSHQAMDPGLQETPDPAGRLAVSRRRRPLIRMIAALLSARRVSPRSVRSQLRSPRSRPVTAVAADMNKVIRHVFPAGEEGFDPAAAHDLYSGTVMQVIFETLLTYDYLARPSKLVPLTAEALPTDHRQRPDLHAQDQEGHPLHARPRVQGRQARAGGRRLRVFVQAADGPGDPFAVDMAARRQDRRPRRTGREGEKGRRQVRLRRQGRGTRGRRPLHAAHPPEAARLQPLVRARARADERGRARGRRRVWRLRRPHHVESRSAPARTSSPNGSARRRSTSRRIRTSAASRGISRRAPIPTTRASSPR